MSRALAADRSALPFNLAPPASLGADCRAGATAISVDGDGNVRPCHFVRRDLGNLYDGSFARMRARSGMPERALRLFYRLCAPARRRRVARRSGTG